MDVFLTQRSLGAPSNGENMNFITSCCKNCAIAADSRLKCVFNESCSESQYGNLTVKQDVAKQIYCHSCEVRGNLLTLIQGLENHRPPEGGHLRAPEFKQAVAKLKQINGEATTSPEQRPYKISQEMQQKRRAYESTPLPKQDATAAAT